MRVDDAFKRNILWLTLYFHQTSLMAGNLLAKKKTLKLQMHSLAQILSCYNEVYRSVKQRVINLR